MKKFFALGIAICFVMFSGNVFGQDAAKAKNDKKGGFSAGGYDQSRKSKAPTRSIDIYKEVEKPDKSIDMDKSAEDTLKFKAPAPANAPEAKEAPATVRPKEGDKEKGKQGDACGQNKSKPWKDASHSSADDAKPKEKPKNDIKPEKEQK